MPFPLEIDILRHGVLWPETLVGRKLEEIISQDVFAALQISNAKMSGPAALSLLLTNDDEQQQLNKKWRGQDRSTNVLSFSQIAPFAPVSGLLGDISLAHETVVREALELQKPLCDHLSHLVVHGFLHILGYDHQTDKEASEMESLETRVLAYLAIADPYA